MIHFLVPSVGNQWRFPRFRTPTYAVQFLAVAASVAANGELETGDAKVQRFGREVGVELMRPAGLELTHRARVGWTFGANW